MLRSYRTLFLISWILSVAPVTASSQDRVFKFWIEFSGPKSSSYSIAEPGDFLSERAIERRHNQGIVIDESDIPVSGDLVDSLKAMGTELLMTSRWFNGAAVKTKDSLLLQKLLKKSWVSQGELVYKGSGPVPAAGLKKGKTGVPELLYGVSEKQITLMNGNFLHEQNLRGQGMVIAVLDAGFYMADDLSAFDSLWAGGRILGVRDFANPGGNPFTESSHGMSVLSLMGSNDPGHLIGTAPEASFWLLRSEDTHSEWRIEEVNWLAAAEFADSAGADIINSSLGYSLFDDPQQNHSYKDMDGKTTLVSRAAQMAANKGILVVNSAGNSGNSSWKYITAPADAAGVLAVGAVDTNGVIVSFSSYGPTWDRRIKPNTLAVGLRTQIFLTSNMTGPGNGTSFASPLIAGMAACLWQKFPMVTNFEIKAAIEQSSSLYNRPDDHYGYGLPDFMAAEYIVNGIHNSKLPPGSTGVIYPNPCTDHILISIRQTGTGWMEVNMYDLSGRLAFRTTRQVPSTGTVVVEGLDRLSPGYYLVDVRINGTGRKFKLLKL